MKRQTPSSQSLLGICFALYAIALLIITLALGHYPWPSANTKGARVHTERTQPPDFKAIKEIEQRKAAFFAYFRPLISRQNEAILAQREVVAKLKSELATQPKLTRASRKLLTKLAEEYAVEESSPSVTLSELDLRIGPLPEALVLAQAATESAWGKSRFAREGNNYFGHWCFSAGCGLVPKRRNTGADHEVAVFDSAEDSLAAYYKNINTFSAYKKLRKSRLKMLQSNQPITAAALLPYLSRYSQRGEAYIQQIQTIIYQNNLAINIPQEPQPSN